MDHRPRLQSRLITRPDLTAISFSDFRHAINDVGGDCDGGRQTHLLGLLAAAYQYVEQHTGRALLRQVREVEVANPGKMVHLPFPPVVHIQCVEFSTADCTTGRECWSELRSSQYDYSGRSLWLKSCCCASWPCGCCPRVRVRYECGPTELDPMAFMAIAMLAGHWDFNRIASSDLTIREVPMGLSDLIATMRIRRLVNAS